MTCTRKPTDPPCGVVHNGWTCCGNPDMATNITASEIDMRYKNIPPMGNALLEGIIDRTFNILRKRGLIP